MRLISSLQQMWYAACGTKWRRYFSTNGARTYRNLRWTGWREHYNGDIYGAYSGQASDGELYYATATVGPQLNCGISAFGPEHVSRAMQLHRDEKQKKVQDFILTFLNPKCRCRYGYHYRCEIHGKWMN